MKINHNLNEVDYVKDYYNKIVSKLEKINSNSEFSIFGLNPPTKTGGGKIFVNYEHNLVSPKVPYYDLFGKIATINDPNTFYRVRIENIDAFLTCKFYIDYSLPNIKNIESCVELKSHLSKIIYFPPLLTEYDPISNDRSTYDVVTSFYFPNPDGRPRRKIVMDELRETFHKYVNIPRVFGKELYESYYKQSKILLNLHQTDFHQTFEELRVLPALLNGMIVIAEDSPLKESIPYHEYIIWVKYENLISKTTEVLQNYDYYYDLIHGHNSNLKNIIEKMENNLENTLQEKFGANKIESLSEIFNKWGSDKGTYFTHKFQTQNIAHNYTLIYEQQLEKFRNDEFNMLEIGIWSPYYPGASVKAWTEYFPKVNFYGIDIAEDCKQMESERVTIDIVDQSSQQQLIDYISKVPEFDLIIDDGCHEEIPIVTSLGILFKHLKSGGLYYVEDLHVVDKTRLYPIFWGRLNHPVLTQEQNDYINKNLDWCSFSPDGKLMILKKKIINHGK